MEQPSRWYLGRWGRVGLSAALLTLAACGSGGDGSTEPPPPATGSLTVSIGGLPAGVSAAVTVTGPGGFSRTLTASETIATLTPGVYTVTSASVTVSDGRFGASPATQPVTVVAGANPAIATVTYALATGSLTVTISGLAAGVNGQVTVTGPNGFTRALTATQTLTVLEPGGYTVTAADVTASETRYAALPPTQGVAVNAASTPSNATVTYGAATGRLAVTILGLPPGSAAAVTVSGPGNFSQVLTSSATLTLLAPGNYTVIAGDVQVGNFTFRGTAPVSQSIAVAASTVAAVATVRYAAIDGSLGVSIAGLPTGVDGNVTITGPAAFSRTIQNNQTLARLTPGIYTLTAAVVTSGTTVFSATPDVQTITVNAGAAASATVTYAPSISLRLEPVTSALSRPVHLASPPNDNSRLIVVEQAGLIRLVKNGQLLVQPFLDISTRIATPVLPDDERGALGIAFHPQYQTNGYFFVYFIDAFQNIVVERFQVSGNPDVANNTGTAVITIGKPNDPYHNGGAITFGADGFLYLGIGDGICCNDPLGNGQATNTLLAKILRINVDALPYSVPPTNPFVGQAGRRAEIWMYGVRNPWRIDVDPTAGILYIADVGESAFEEVNALTSMQAGANLGWNIMEGPQCRAGPGCNTQGLTLPVISYSHADGCSITGGHVYRGTQLLELAGHYFYSDYCRGFLRSFALVNGVATQQRDWGIASPGLVTSFGKDASGELYILTQAGGLFRIVRQ